MNKTMLKIKKYTELYYPLILSLVVVLITYFWLSKNIVFKGIVNKILLDSTLSLIISTEATLFGFLLAVLALILQMNNKLIQAIKEAARFNDLISFSKKAVYASFTVVVITIIILLIKDILIIKMIKDFVFYLWGFSIIYSILSAFRFVKIFFMLANSN
jgi:hypothetical protein